MRVSELREKEPASLEEGRGHVRHLPVQHVAQGLVSDARIHRRARLPSNQIGSIVKKMDVDQVKGTAEREGNGDKGLGLQGRLAWPRSLRRCGAGARGSQRGAPPAPTPVLLSHLGRPRARPLPGQRGCMRPQGQLRRGCFLSRKRCDMIAETFLEPQEEGGRRKRGERREEAVEGEEGRRGGRESRPEGPGEGTVPTAGVAEGPPGTGHPAGTQCPHPAQACAQQATPGTHWH